MSIDEVRARISELSAELDQSVEEHLARLGLLPARPEGAHDRLLAQARVELAVYTGAMKSVFELLQRAVDTGDHDLATQAHTVMTAMEESLALARATVDELQREDADAL